ncbi:MULTISPECIES: hypothetical protein [Marinobacter]|uniref:hypothetical protein n=1 Tax=Marinobacter TaxID=2742 RepID=UPI0035B881B6
MDRRERPQTVLQHPHPRFSHIHPKTISLMLNREDFDMWLDPSLTNTDSFQDLLKTRIRQRLLVEPISSPTDLNAIGPGFFIQSD